MVDKLKRDDDYEYGYDYLYEEKAPTGVTEDVEKPDDGDSDDEPDDAGGLESILAMEHIMSAIA